MVDIGACAGVWTVYMLKVLQARHGIAVEPSPIPAFHLRANLELMNISSSRVTMRQNALTPADGQGEEVRFEYNTKDDLQNGQICTTDDVGRGLKQTKYGLANKTRRPIRLPHLLCPQLRWDVWSVRCNNGLAAGLVCYG